MPKKTVIIHGHFYQPPRINPWTGILNNQQTAYPADNWNQRIFYECYLPNTLARITSPVGIKEEVNNFELISFNIGPTLSTWMAENYNETYRKILEADKLHHNAIALPYNHTILPLDDEIISDVQIEWGIKEFQMRYGRYPSSMWLPECAVSYRVVEKLIDKGMKFLVLTRFQAKEIKRLHGKHWQDVSDGSLDVRRPYRLFTEAEVGYIDVFFSHHELSMDISFNKVLNNTTECANRIEKVFGKKYSEDTLVTIVTDGETFGHHHSGGEKGLAYLLKYELPSRGINVSTFEKYLSEYPVEWEVKIKDNSSWSCAHGIERWRSDCGCGKEDGSDLKWRKPLRDAISFLGQKVIEFFDERAAKYFKVAKWDAVNNYGEVLSNISKLNNFHENFVAEEYKNSVEVNKVLQLIHFSFYSWTSCGWFFGALSRLEPIQNLSFALRAMELLKELWGADIENDFYNILNQHQDANYVWNNLVKNQRVSPEKLAQDFKEMYKNTGIEKNRLGDWFLEVVDGGKVRMENLRTKEILKL